VQVWSLTLTGKRPKIQETSSPPTTSSVDGFGPERVDHSNTCSLHIGERLCKLEQLFERFVCRKTSLASPSPDVPRSPTLVGSSDRESNSGLVKLPSDTQSLSSLGEGIVSHSRCVASTVLTNIAWCTNVDISAFYPHTSQQAGQCTAF
jgi:hypothetical protein